VVGALLLAVVCAASVPVASGAAPAESHSWLRNPGMVAHAMGGLRIGSRVYTYTDSLQAFQQNYAKGYRIFEVDLIPTSDNRLVARHDWTSGSFTSLGQTYPGHVPTHSVFMKTKILKSYTPLDIEAIAQLMRTHPDMYIITDTKGETKTAVRNEMQLLRKGLGPDRDALSQRVIVQIYSQPMLEWVGEIYRFPNIIFTLYKLPSTAGAVDFAKANRIPVIVYDTTRWSLAFAAQIRAAGIASALHTVNSSSTAATLRKYHVRYIYTDALPSGTLTSTTALAPSKVTIVPTHMKLGKHGD